MAVGIVDLEVFYGVGLMSCESSCESIKKIHTKMLNAVTISLKVKTKMGI